MAVVCRLLDGSNHYERTVTGWVDRFATWRRDTLKLQCSLWRTPDSNRS